MKVLYILRRENSNNSGFSVTEVIVAALVFALVTVGLFSSVTALNEPAKESVESVTAAYIGKQILDDFRKEVSAGTWAGGPLDPAGSPYTLNAITVDGITYTPVYTVVNDPSGASGRIVTLNIVW